MFNPTSLAWISHTGILLKVMYLGSIGSRTRQKAYFELAAKNAGAGGE
jgi:hypothetical protein